MSEPDIEKQLSDAVIVCAGRAGSKKVVLHTASKIDAEFLYSSVDPIAKEREIQKTEHQGLHREYYLELAESDNHSLDDEDQFSWNTRPVWQVRFTPTEFLHQRMLHWANQDRSKKAPTDFKMTPLIAEFIYRAGAHEMSGEDGEAYVEFDAEDSQKLEAELQNLDIQTTNVGDLWRMDAENSAKFRAYAGVPAPRTQVDTVEDASNGGD